MRRIRTSCCLAVMLSGALAWADDFTELAQRAVQRQQAGDYAAAAEAYQSALRLKPDDVATEVNLGVVLVQLSRFDEAIAHYRAADKLLPGDPRIRLNMALAYEKSGRLREAHDGFATLHAATPEDRKLTMLLADSDLQLGQEDDVVALLAPLARQDESDPGLAYMLGMALLRKGRTADGQVFLDRILRNGDTAEARFLMGTRMFEAGDYPAAAKELARAAELNPQLPQVQSLYGRALLNTGDPDAATKAFRAELRTNPGDYEANLGLAQILAARKQSDEGLAFGQRALQVRSDSTEAKLVVAGCLTGEKRYREALPYAEAVLGAQPGSAEAHAAVAAAEAGLGRTGEAAAERKKAASLAQAADPGPKLREAAPEFTLPDSVSGNPVELRALRSRQPVVLVFGSYSCPNFRDAAGALTEMSKRYNGRVSFWLVYVREAHAGSDWQSTRNAQQNITLEPAHTFAEKQEHATMCSRKLHLPFRAMVDGMDGAVEKMYNAWPSRVYVIGEDGEVRYGSRLTELAFHPAEMEAALRQALR